MNEQEQEFSLTTPDQMVRRLSRRRLIAGSSVTLAAAGLVSLGTASVTAWQTSPAPSGTPQPGGTSAASPVAGRPSQMLMRPAAFFNVHEAQTVDALVSRLL